ncbi:MAG: alpha/beta hydrolase [Nocardia sp.]|uniref:alpha/beta fold hydrolase n=1 Tax=Nocardia sp. TaxID=1821 RepID=UPI00262A13CC|nr:alpha/beta hydrolase [Nocardia sp.]MCU1643774.1 alpha/beta hydrolase [Nocardia sp.]
MTSTTPVTTGFLTVPDGRLYYEVRGSGPLLALVGAPMDSGPFVAAAELLASDYTVLTPDPRGHGKSTLNDPNQDSTPELRADDLARLITNLDAGPAIVIGSSGGAVTGLALALLRPDLMSTLIAHEPPLRELLDDRDAQRAESEDTIATYSSGDAEGGVRKFFATTGLSMPEPVLQQMFANPRDPEAVASEAFFYKHEFRGTAGWEPDLDGLRTTPTHLIIGIGDTSTDLFCDHTSRKLGAALGIEPELFPGGHGGFMEDPEAFVKRVREVLRDN